MSEMTGTINAPTTIGEPSEKTNTGSSAGAESDDSESSQEGQERAGNSKEFAEGGSDEGQKTRQRGPSKIDTIRQLRAKIRDRESFHEQRYSSLEERLNQWESRFKSASESKKPSKTFWEAPEEVLDDRIKGHFSEFEKRIIENLQNVRTLDQQTTEWQSETSEATKFIQSQKLTPEDEDDIAEIVRSTPAMENLRPMDRAKYALFLWKEEKGISQDRSALKAKAASVQGMSTQGAGQKTWTESEMEQEMAKFPTNQSQWTEDDHKRFRTLNLEFERAYKDGRVKK